MSQTFIFVAFTFGFTDVPSTSRNVEREHHPTHLHILILPLGKPQVTIQILEHQHDSEQYKPQQHREFIPKHDLYLFPRLKGSKTNQKLWALDAERCKAFFDDEGVDYDIIDSVDSESEDDDEDDDEDDE